MAPVAESTRQRSTRRRREIVVVALGVIAIMAIAFSRSGGEHVQTGPASRPTSTTPSSIDYIECQDHTTIPKRGADASRAPFDVANEKCPHVSGEIILAHCPTGILAVTDVEIAGSASGPPDSDTIPPGPPPSMPLDPCQNTGSSSGAGK